MSMFGGGFGGPGPGGAPMGGVGGAGPKGQSSSGIPFSGIPPELMAGVARLEADEPAIPCRGKPSPTGRAGERPLSMLSMAAAHRSVFVWAVLLVVLETLLLQAGPYLVQVGIDHGMVARDKTVLLLAAARFRGVGGGRMGCHVGAHPPDRAARRRGHPQPSRSRLRRTCNGCRWTTTPTRRPASS